MQGRDFDADSIPSAVPDGVPEIEQAQGDAGSAPQDQQSSSASSWLHPTARSLSVAGSGRAVSPARGMISVKSLGKGAETCSQCDPTCVHQR